MSFLYTVFDKSYFLKNHEHWPGHSWTPSIAILKMRRAYDPYLHVEDCSDHARPNGGCRLLTRLLHQHTCPLKICDTNNFPFHATTIPGLVILPSTRGTKSGFSISVVPLCNFGASIGARRLLSSRHHTIPHKPPSWCHQG